MNISDITDEEIIALYKNGMSQKDICRKFDICYKHTSEVLKKAGFHTSKYRRCPVKHEDIIYKLYIAGISMSSIAKATDMSFHVIRDIIKRMPSRPERAIYENPFIELNDKDALFLSRYISGETFLLLCVDLNANNEDLLRFFSCIDENIMKKHSYALCKRLNAEDMQNCTVTSLARKYGISSTVVKSHLNI